MLCLINFFFKESCGLAEWLNLWAGRAAQAVECLPSKSKALSSNPNTTHTKKDMLVHFFNPSTMEIYAKKTCEFKVSLELEKRLVREELI
jgi:hypothetical protein